MWIRTISEIIYHATVRLTKQKSSIGLRENSNNHAEILGTMDFFKFIFFLVMPENFNDRWGALVVGKDSNEILFQENDLFDNIARLKEILETKN